MERTLDLSNPDLSWMSGSWFGEVWGGRMEEHWTSQEGRTLLGMNRVVRDGKTVHKEFIWIESTEKGTCLSVRVFREPEETVVYALAEIGNRKAVFSNAKHRRLMTMTYSRDEQGLVIILEGEKASGTYREEIRLQRTS